MQLLFHEPDIDVFYASTIISLCNGGKAVKREFQDNKWIRSAARINSPMQLFEFVKLWEFLSQIQLHANRRDSISSSWTANGIYSSSMDFLA
jgi:hypothetical protein